MSPSLRDKIPVAVLGATGAVGQRLLALLADHPFFEVAELGASERSVGRTFADAVTWRLETPLPEVVAGKVVSPCKPEDLGAPLIFSALDRHQASRIEPLFAAAGRTVISNASAFRMEPDVPLVIAELNPDHLALIDIQRKKREWEGCLVAHPNCSTIGLTMALAPIHRAVGVRSLVVTTLQAASGAGYPGVSAMDLIDNVVPGIQGEEEKIESEPMKILGSLEGDGVAAAEMAITAHTHRVPVSDGHLMSVSLKCERPISPAEAMEVLSTFRGRPQERSLPSAPEDPIIVLNEEHRPQPRLDRDRGKGMSTTVSRVGRCSVLDLRFEVLTHNTVRGAAGGTLLIAEWMHSEGAWR